MATLGIFLAGAPSLWAADLNLEVRLIWGTNDKQSPDPTHKPVGTNTLAKLRSLPLNFANYFEVGRTNFVVPLLGSKKIAMSKECEIVVRSTGGDNIELALFGKGQRVGLISQALPKGEHLVTGGQAPNSTAWFVTLKQVD